MQTGLKLKALSAQVGNMDCIQCLLNHKADVDARDKTKKQLCAWLPLVVTKTATTVCLSIWLMSVLKIIWATCLLFIQIIWKYKMRNINANSSKFFGFVSSGSNLNPVSVDT
jgi:hypothetical protein